MGTNNNLTQGFYQIFISSAHDDYYLNAVTLLFQNQKKIKKECDTKVFLHRVRLLLVQKWLELIQNIKKKSKCFILLSHKRTIKKNRYVDKDKPIIGKEFYEIKSAGMI